MNFNENIQIDELYTDEYIEFLKLLFANYEEESNWDEDVIADK